MYNDKLVYPPIQWSFERTVHLVLLRRDILLSQRYPP